MKATLIIIASVIFSWGGLNAEPIQALSSIGFERVRLSGVLQEASLTPFGTMITQFQIATDDEIVNVVFDDSIFEAAMELLNQEVLISGVEATVTPIGPTRFPYPVVYVKLIAKNSSLGF